MKTTTTPYISAALLIASIGVCAGAIVEPMADYEYRGTDPNSGATFHGTVTFPSSALEASSILGQDLDYTEIGSLSFELSGSPQPSYDGTYAELWGGSLGFGSESPGPSNLPTNNGLLISNSQGIPMLIGWGPPNDFLLLDGPGGTFSGEWEYTVVPEPGIVLSLAGALLVWTRSRRRALCWSS